MFSFSFSCADLLHGNCLLTGFDFSIKILLAKIIFLFWILLRYLLNMSSFSIDSIFWCCFFVTSFRCSSHVPLFRGILTDLPVFRCSATVTVFDQCSAGVPCFVVPCSSVQHFIVCWSCPTYKDSQQQFEKKKCVSIKD